MTRHKAISALAVAVIFTVPFASAHAIVLQKAPAGSSTYTNYKDPSYSTSSYYYDSSSYYYPSYNYSYGSSYSTCDQLLYCSNPGLNYYSYNSYYPYYSYYSPGWSPYRQIYNQPNVPNNPSAPGSPGWDPNRQVYVQPDVPAQTNSGSAGWDADRQLLHQASTDTYSSNGSSGWNEDRQLLRQSSSGDNYDTNYSRTSRSNRNTYSSRTVTTTRQAPAYSYCDQILPGSQLDDGSCRN